MSGTLGTLCSGAEEKEESASHHLLIYESSEIDEIDVHLHLLLLGSVPICRKRGLGEAGMVAET